MQRDKTTFNTTMKAMATVWDTISIIALLLFFLVVRYDAVTIQGLFSP